MPATTLITPSRSMDRLPDADSPVSVPPRQKQRLASSADSLQLNRFGVAALTATGADNIQPARASLAPRAVSASVTDRQRLDRLNQDQGNIAALMSFMDGTSRSGRANFYPHQGQSLDDVRANAIMLFGRDAVKDIVDDAGEVIGVGVERGVKLDAFNVIYNNSQVRGTSVELYEDGSVEKVGAALKNLFGEQTRITVDEQQGRLAIGRKTVTTTEVSATDNGDNVLAVKQTVEGKGGVYTASLQLTSGDTDKLIGELNRISGDKGRFVEINGRVEFTGDKKAFELAVKTINENHSGEWRIELQEGADGAVGGTIGYKDTYREGSISINIGVDGEGKTQGEVSYTSESIEYDTTFNLGHDEERGDYVGVQWRVDLRAVAPKTVLSQNGEGFNVEDKRTQKALGYHLSRLLKRTITINDQGHAVDKQGRRIKLEVLRTTLDAQGIWIAAKSRKPMADYLLSRTGRSASLRLGDNGALFRRQTGAPVLLTLPMSSEPQQRN